MTNLKRDVTRVVRAGKILQNRQPAYRGSSGVKLNNTPNPNMSVEPTNKLVTPHSLTRLANKRGFEFGLKKLGQI